MTIAASVPAALQTYVDRGFRLLCWERVGPANPEWKGPHSTGWNDKTRVYDPTAYRDQQVGTFTGHEIRPGHFLADVDFDWDLGVPLSPRLLPGTDFGFGHGLRIVTHAFYTTPERVETKKYKDIDDKQTCLVEIRGGDSTHQTMLPPSLHPNDGVMTLARDGDIAHVTGLEQSVRHYAIACILLRHLPNGACHDARNAIAGFLLKAGLSESAVLAIGEALCSVQGRDVADMRHAVESAAKKIAKGGRVTGRTELTKTIGPDGKKVVGRILEWLGEDAGGSVIPGKSIVTKLINLGLSKAELFRSPDGDLYVTVGPETLPLTDKTFKSWLALQYFTTTQSGVGGGDLGSAVTTLCGAARSSEQTHEVYTRVAAIGNTVYLDLCRDDYAVLTITAEGWTVGPTDVRFVRREGMRPLPIPCRGGSLMELLPRVVNVQGDDLKLFIAWLVACLRGRKPYPILVIKGEHGTAKTSACKTARDFLDPSKVDLSFTPKEPRDLIIAAHNSHVLGFDNLSTLPHWLSDVLCSVATGAGFRTRQLTTDMTETLFSAARPIILNSITDVVHRQDMVDRSLMVTLSPISDEDRRTEAEMDRRIAEVQPAILAALAEAVSCALRNPITLSRLPRMADFATVIESAAPALGWKPDEFLNIYSANRDEAVASALNNDLVFQFMLARRDDALSAPPHVGGPEPWIVESQELLLGLINVTPLELRKQVPTTASGLLGELRRLAPALRKAGIEWQEPKPRRIAGKLKRAMEIRYVGDQEALAL